MRDQTGEVSAIIGARLMQAWAQRLFPFPEKSTGMCLYTEKVMHVLQLP